MSATSPARDLDQLARLIAARNDWERETSAIIGRPALIGNLGEYIAAQVFNIRLHKSGSHQASDGLFVDGPLAGQTVNVKWYARQEVSLDLAPGCPDVDLVLAGPRATAALRGDPGRPWLFDSAHLFLAGRLIEQLRDVKLGVATSIRRALWDAAELYPVARCPDYTLSEGQREMLRLFDSGDS